MQRSVAYHVARKIIAVLLIVIGLLALVTPLTPGSWLMFIGFEMLGFELLFVKRLRAWLGGRHRRAEEN